MLLKDQDQRAEPQKGYDIDIFSMLSSGMQFVTTEHDYNHLYLNALSCLLVSPDILEPSSKCSIHLPDFAFYVVILNVCLDPTGK